MQAKAGDRVIVESERVGDSAREGVVLEVLGMGEGLHYRVRWEDGHESTFFPSGGSMRIVPQTKESRSRP
jgi:uncharacterized protein DUF1918